MLRSGSGPETPAAGTRWSRLVLSFMLPSPWWGRGREERKAEVGECLISFKPSASLGPSTNLHNISIYTLQIFRQQVTNLSHLHKTNVSNKKIKNCGRTWTGLQPPESCIPTSTPLRFSHPPRQWIRWTSNAAQQNYCLCFFPHFFSFVSTKTFLQSWAQYQQIYFWQMYFCSSSKFSSVKNTVPNSRCEKVFTFPVKPLEKA